MKKGVKGAVVLFALVLVLPALCFAGSATSRWDLTIGGYVKFDMGYNTQSNGVDTVVAARSGYGAYDSYTDQTGNYFSYAGETRLNFRVKGPDAWGAKTSAFIEGHFRGTEGATSGTYNQGTFVLRHAHMIFDWPETKLTIGQAWNKWGNLPTFSLVGFNDIGLFLKGQRQPQIRVDRKFFKDWTLSVAIISPTDVMGRNKANTSSGVVNGFTRSPYPFFEAELEWRSPKCGKIGPWPMLFALGGFYGQEKQYVGIYTGSASAPTSLTYYDKNINSWGMAFKGFIPVIPERKGHKKGALAVSGNVFYAQNPSWFNSIGSSYARTDSGDVSQAANILLGDATPDFAAPVQYGGWGHVSYYLTDKLWVNFLYGYVRVNYSKAYQATAAQANQIQNMGEITGTIMYQVNDAIKFGFEYSYFTTRYAGYGTLVNGSPTQSKDGSAQVYRVGAYYFF